MHNITFSTAFFNSCLFTFACNNLLIGFQVFLQDLNGRTSTVDVSSTMSIDLLKTKVPAMRGICSIIIMIISQGFYYGLNWNIFLSLNGAEL